MNLSPEFIAQGLTSYVVLLFSLSFHEAAHAWAALKMGDPTAEREGRITLNPLPHIDPIGTVVLPLVFMFTAGAAFLGWAKPTPYEPGNFDRHRSVREGHIKVAGAGPLSNLLLACLFTAALFVAVRLDLRGAAAQAVGNVLQLGVQMNVLLALFNLLPVPPLDGSKVASFGLPREMGEQYDKVMEPFGPIILLLLMVTGAAFTLIEPFLRIINNFLFSLVR